MDEAWAAYAACNNNKSAAAAKLGLNVNTFRNRLDAAVAQMARQSDPADYWTHPPHIARDVHDGVIVVGSDAHRWWPKLSVAETAMIAVCKALNPAVVVLNGDIVDGARTNRHDPHGWNKRPSVKEEIEACHELTHELEQAAPHAERIYTLGNHCLNFERRLVQHAKEFEGLYGFRLHDHFPRWDFAWSLRLNWAGEHRVMVKHRRAGGVHAGYNNALKSGVTMVTGHTHQLEVKPWGDYTGRRYGVQTGCLADPDGPQFEYQEAGYNSHCSGFAVLTFRDGELLTPELCEVKRGRAWFRGQVWAESGE
jgi:hypothetical protein